ncbi:MAG: site-specific DNA-methyltransferase [Promethearchaeota archaeon]
MKNIPPPHGEGSLISIFGDPLVQLENGMFFLDRYFQAKLVEHFHQENHITSHTFDKKTLKRTQKKENDELKNQNSIGRLLSGFYQSNIGLEHIGKITPFGFWNFSSVAIPFRKRDSVLGWRGKNILSIQNHEFFKFYRFSHGSKTFIILLKNGETSLNRIQLQKMYFQPSEKDPFRVISYETGKLILVSILEYRSITQSQKATYKGKNIQGRLNDETVSLWCEFVKSHDDQVSVEKAILRSALAHHIDIFTKAHAFSIPIYYNYTKYISTQLPYFIQQEWFSHPTTLREDKSIGLELLHSGVFEWNRRILEPIDQLYTLKRQMMNKPPWLLDNHYCITVDLIPEAILDKIIDEVNQNPQQFAEWCELFPTIILDNPSEPLTSQFIQDHPTLMIDTRFFSADFQTLLTTSIPQFESHIEGWVIRSENRRALKMLHTYFPRFRNKVDCIYTDPPYNTGNNEFVYRDSLGHANWLTMMSEILDFLPKIGTPGMNFFISIDDNEYSRLNLLIEEKWGKETIFGPILVQVNKGGRDYLPIAKTHEYLIAGSLNGEYNNFNELPKPLEGTVYSDPQGNFVVRELRNRNPKFNRSNRPNLFYSFYIDPDTRNPNGFCAVSLESTQNHTVETIPVTSKDVHDCWRWSKSKVSDNLNSIDPDLSEIVARQKRTGGWNIYEKHRKTTTKSKSLWIESEVRTEAGTIDMRQLFPSPIFDHPKPVALIEKCLAIGSNPDSIICDPFAGSGTTGHAVINLNYRDGGFRKYILIERANNIGSVILPRLKKLTLTPVWIEGEPQFPSESSKKSSKIIQYFSLEQSEDVYLNTNFSVLGDLNPKSPPSPSQNPSQNPSLHSSQPFSQRPSDSNLLATILKKETPHFPSNLDILQYKLVETPSEWKFSPSFPKFQSKSNTSDLETGLRSIRIPFYTYNSMDKCLHSISLLESVAAYMEVSASECCLIFGEKENPVKFLMEFCSKVLGFNISKD